MGLKISLTIAKALRATSLVAGFGLMSACAVATDPNGINDPYEVSNRNTHELNRSIDKALLGPASKGFGGAIPKPVTRGISNLADTLDLPGDIANNLLQLRLGDAAQNTLRLAVNLTMGVGGVFDASTALGLPGKPTDFGETLHVWGAAEGAYMELPFVGPSTERDAVGMVVDLALNPVRLALPKREAIAAMAIKLASRLGDRDRFSETVESILYDSADSYAQARLLYLQNRRFALKRAGGDDALDDDFIDPYEDPYAE